jgi:endoglucanase
VRTSPPVLLAAVIAAASIALALSLVGRPGSSRPVASRARASTTTAASGGSGSAAKTAPSADSAAPGRDAARSAATVRAGAPPDAGIVFPLHTSGASIVDAKGTPVKLNLVNWYGAESPDFVVGGLKYQPVTEIVSEIAAMGFDGVRLPWSNQMWQSNPVVPAALVAANPQFKGEHARTVFEQVVQDLANAGLMVVLDDHNSNAEWCCSSTDGNTLWYNSAYPQSAWLADWKAVAAQFKNTPQVIGVDLRNEPRGAATWGGSNPSVDWHAAAELGGDAVQSADSKLLIFVEGTDYATDLSGAGSLPVRLNVAGHVVYSVHDYGFDTTVTSYDDWVSKIQSHWGYLVGKVPLWVGEFGTCNTSGTCVSSGSTADLGKWFAIFTRYLRYHDMNWSYWAVNGTKSDGAPGQGITYGETETYGVLNTKWDAAALPSLLASLHAIQPACPAGPVAGGTYYIKNRSSGDVIDIPAFKSVPGTDLDQWPRNGGVNQKWKLTSLGCGLYSIRSAMDGESVDIDGQSTSSGARVDQYGYWGGGNQQFLIVRNAAGFYTISSINSMDPVQVSGSSAKAGTLLDQGAPASGANQQWSFVPA